MNDKAIFNLSWGGNLGDNLLFSTLPELYHKINKEFYLYSKTMFRNDEIKKLVWDENPYVKGITDEIPNIIVNKDIITNVFEKNCIENVEAINGFVNSGNKYPIIYYKPRIIESLKDVTILALGTISQSPYYNDDYLKSMISKIINYDDNLLLLKYKKNIGGTSLYHYNYPSDIYYVDDIYHHCDIILSCKKYITVQSGSAVLSSAIIGNSNKSYVILAQETKNLVLLNNIFKFDNLNYIY